jgi:hypothetical protein
MNGVSEGPQPGTIWRTVPASNMDLFGPLVFIITGDGPDSVRVAEVSEDIEHALENDMVLEPRQSGIVFRFMVRAGNVFSMNPDKLTDYAGRLSPSRTEAVIEFCRVGDRFDDNIPLSEYIFFRDSQGSELMHRRGVVSGTLLIGDDDPRLKFLEESKARTAYLIKASVKTFSENVVKIDRSK